MASGPVCRTHRPNTWLHRPMLQTCRKFLPTRSRPHMALSGHELVHRTCPLSSVKRTLLIALHMSACDPKRTLFTRDSRLK